MNLFSAAQLTDSGYRVILDVDSCSLRDDSTKAVVGAGPRRHDSSFFFLAMTPRSWSSLWFTSVILTSSRYFGASLRRCLPLVSAL
jgi:hypothetical protein